MAKPRVLVLGGGPGGVVAAVNLARRLGGEAEVTLVDKTGRHLYPPSLLWVMTGLRRVDDIQRPLSRLERRGINVVVAEVREIVPDEGRVETSQGPLEYDYLVVALGSVARPEKAAVPGSRECTPWTTTGAEECRRLLAGLRRGGRVVVTAWGFPYKCPPGPFEAAFLVKYLLEQRGAPGEVTVAHFWREPMEPFGPQLVKVFRAFMERYGVAYEGGFEPVEADGSRVRGGDGRSLEYDLLIYVPVHEPPEAVARSPLAREDLGGWMDVDKRTLRHPKYSNVWGVGDVIAPTMGLGMAGVFAHFQAEYVASQVADEVLGTSMGEHYNTSGICVMDLGYAGAAVYCDFAPKIYGGAPYPECTVIGGMKAFRALKIAFERFWLEKWFS